MIQSAFRKFYWGFLFIMIDFRIQGFDILPDFIGFILFAGAFSILASNSEYFSSARNYNFPMIILALFTFYETPAQGNGIQLGYLGPFGIIIAIASIVLGLMVVYNLFMGIKDMAETHELMDIYTEAEQRWSQYLMLQIALLLAFVLIIFPPLAILYIVGLFIAAIVLTVRILGFMKVCEESFSDNINQNFT